jgi:hypothetical protein
MARNTFLCVCDAPSWGDLRDEPHVRQGHSRTFRETALRGVQNDGGTNDVEQIRERRWIPGFPIQVADRDQGHNFTRSSRQCPGRTAAESLHPLGA